MFSSFLHKKSVHNQNFFWFYTLKFILSTYPVITQFKLDTLARDSLGTYYMNNGIVVFVYRDGRTYVTKGYKVIQYLNNAGYRERCMFVPFSNGEEIMHDAFRAKWEAIRKWR